MSSGRENSSMRILPASCAISTAAWRLFLDIGKILEELVAGSTGKWKSENGKWPPYTTPGNSYRYQKTEVTKFDGCKSLKIKNGQMAKQNDLRRVRRERVKEILEKNGDGAHPPPGNNAKL